MRCFLTRQLLHVNNSSSLCALLLCLLRVCAWVCVSLWSVGCGWAGHAPADAALQASAAATGLSETGDEEEGDDLDEGVSCGNGASCLLVAGSSAVVVLTPWVMNISFTSASCSIALQAITTQWCRS